MAALKKYKEISGLLPMQSLRNSLEQKSITSLQALGAPDCRLPDQRLRVLAALERVQRDQRNAAQLSG